MTLHKPWQTFLLVSIALLVTLGVWGYWQYRVIYPQTNDAYVKTHIERIASDVSGRVSRVWVRDNQTVKAGQRLFSLDPTPFQLAVAQAKATLDSARSPAQHQQATAALALAKLNLTHTIVSAKTDGTVTQLTLRPGELIAAGRPLFALIGQGSWWVEANFKETALSRVHPGQPVEIHIDLYPHASFKGIVDSISRATGGTFSVLPPQNASGNWIKVTRRIPVKIKIQIPDPRYPLRYGLSSEVTIDTHETA